MRYLLGLTILLVGTILTGQPSSGTTWSLDAFAGTNLALSHVPIYEQNSAGGASLKPGWRFGLAGVMGGQISKSSLVVGLDLVNDRIDLLNFRQEAIGRFFTGQNMLNGIVPRLREGTLTVNETQLRVYVAHRIDFDRFMLNYGFVVSGYVAGSQRFDFTQTTTAWSDPFTEVFVIFDEPLVSQGSTTMPVSELRRNTYGGLYVSGGYSPIPRLHLYLDVELGLHFANRARLANRYKQQRVRLGISAAYRIIGE